MAKVLQGAGETAGLTATLVGTVVGAGFISGAELVRFFPSEGFAAYTVIAAGLFALSFLLLFYAGRKHGGYAGVLAGVFKNFAPAFRIVVLLSSLVMCSSMLAGISATVREGFGLSEIFPFSALIALVLLYFVSYRGVKGIFAVNLALVPLILAFVGAYAFGVPYGGIPYAAADTVSSLVSAILFVAMNAFLASPVVCDAGAKGKGSAACLLSAALIGFCAAAVMANITREGAGALSAEMPFLYVVGKNAALGNLFSAVCLCGILTTLFSSYYPLHNCVNGKKRAPLWRALFCAAAFLLSVLGLKQIVRYIYPLVGGAGTVFLIVVAVRERGLFLGEQFFRKRDERVHTRGEHAKNKGGSHHEIQAHHLPAVHDEIAEPRL